MFEFLLDLYVLRETRTCFSPVYPDSVRLARILSVGIPSGPAGFLASSGSLTGRLLFHT